jgi:hypothetical protein
MKTDFLIKSGGARAGLRRSHPLLARAFDASSVADLACGLTSGVKTGFRMPWE